MKPGWPLALACLIVVVMPAVAAPSVARAKGGQYRPETFRISGGDLPHPVTVSLPEYLMATSGQGSWYTRTSGAPEPAPSATRYHLDLVDASDGSFLLDEQTYAPGTPSVVTSPDGAGWARPIPQIANLLDRYAMLASRGALPERPSFAESLAASSQSLGARVIVDGAALSSIMSARLVALLGEATPVVFGVRGTLIGSRDLHQAQVSVRFGGGSLPFVYVPPGAIAPYGLLFNEGGFGNWGYITMLTPPGYTQTAYTVPDEIDRLMASAGFTGQIEGDIVESRAVPLDKAQLEYGTDRVEVRRGDGAHLTLPPPPEPDPACAEGGCAAGSPVGPFSGDPLDVEVWPRGVDPFPEAVQPARYTYYTGDATGSGRGVLVQTQGSAEADSSSGDVQPPAYAQPAIDAMLRDAEQRLDRAAGARSRARLARTLGFGGAAVIFGVLMISYTAWQAERQRRRRAG